MEFYRSITSRYAPWYIKHKFFLPNWLWTYTNKFSTSWNILTQYASSERETYEWHMNYIGVNMSDIRMTYAYIRLTYEWHTTDFQLTYQVTYKWRVNNWHIEMSTCHWRYHCFSLLYLKRLKYWLEKKSWINFRVWKKSCTLKATQHLMKNVKEIFQQSVKLRSLKKC